MQIKKKGDEILIFNIISELCKERGISIAKLERECGFGNATIRGWVASSPRIENLKIVADYFGVSVDYLVGREERDT